MNDIQIEKSIKKLPIMEVAKKLNIKEEDVDLYGKYKAKIRTYDNKNKLGKLILVTAISPTKFGEGKTTVSIGLADGMARIGKSVCLALREPSLGPVFGVKGGAAGGGYAQVCPMVDINLHFTGDFHAISAANNLLSAAIDNHLHFGNKLSIDPNKIIWRRCIDMNDRALRNVIVGLGGLKDGVIRKDSFTITAASEIMAIICLASGMNDLKARLGRIIVGYSYDDKPIYCKDLKAVDAMAILLKDVLRPNLVQTLEHNPALIHGGPFANIAHGCNTVVATKTALSLADYVVTEAGFGADLGAEKFIDIKCRQAGILPDAVVLVVTIKALKYNSGLDIDYYKENIEALKIGSSNLLAHMENLKKVFGVELVVALNKFANDTDEEIEYIKQLVEDNGAQFATCTAWSDGGKGTEELANIVAAATERTNKVRFAYDLDDTVENKIRAIVTKVYHAKDLVFSQSALDAIRKIEKNNLDKLAICIAKNQYSFSDDPTKLGAAKDHIFHISDVYVKNGAGFIVAVAGSMMLMPGLSSSPALEKMTISNDLEIEGLF